MAGAFVFGAWRGVEWLYTAGRGLHWDGNVCECKINRTQTEDTDGNSLLAHVSRIPKMSL